MEVPDFLLVPSNSQSYDLALLEIRSMNSNGGSLAARTQVRLVVRIEVQNFHCDC